MKLNGYNFDIYRGDVVKHIERHFVGSKVPGSLFLPKVFRNAREVIDFAYNQINDYEGRKIVREFDCERIIGLDGLILLKDVPIHAKVKRDKRESGKKHIAYLGRPNNYTINKVVGIELIPTSFLTIIVGPLDKREEVHGFISIYPGRLAPNFSDKNFWGKHALIENGKIPREYR